VTAGVSATTLLPPSDSLLGCATVRLTLLNVVDRVL
jgi:hypothetical protein